MEKSKRGFESHPKTTPQYFHLALEAALNIEGVLGCCVGDSRKETGNIESGKQCCQLHDGFSLGFCRNVG
jgi:hypothetical protein